MVSRTCLGMAITDASQGRGQLVTQQLFAIHSPIKFYKVPNVIESRIAFPSSKDEGSPETVDVVYNDFLQKYILLALKFLGTDYNEDSTASYIEGKGMTSLLGEWVRENWACKDTTGDGEL